MSRVWVQEMPDNRDYRAFLISAEQIPSKKWDSGIIPGQRKISGGGILKI